jgi:tetratricopeptide (TPR) repeat protein
MLLSCNLARAGTGAADPHLVSGAQHFRDGRYEQALIEFKVAERLGASADVLWYEAATLVKLERSEEAVQVFDRAERLAPNAKDAVMQYYRAMALYQSRLYSLADRALAEVTEAAGPKIAQLVADTRARIAEYFKDAPTPRTVDLLLQRAEGAAAQNRTALAAAYFEEAAALAARRPDRYRQSDAEEGARRVRALAQETVR